MACSPGNSIRCVLLTQLAALLFGGLVTVAAFPAAAEIILEGPANALQIEMRDASLREVLLVLSANYDLRFSSSSALDHSVSGSFKGPLRRLVARLLDDRYDYVMKSANGNLEVVVLSAHHAPPAAPSVGVPAPSAGLAAAGPVLVVNIRRGPRPDRVPASVR